MKVPFPTAESQDLQTSFSDPITTLATASVVPWSAGVVHKPREQHLPPVKCKYLYCILLLGKAGLIHFITAIYRLKLSAQQQTAGATYPAKFHFTQRIQVLMSEILLLLWTQRKWGRFLRIFSAVQQWTEGRVSSYCFIWTSSAEPFYVTMTYYRF